MGEGLTLTCKLFVQFGEKIRGDKLSIDKRVSLDSLKVCREIDSYMMTFCLKLTRSSKVKAPTTVH